jgi:cytochrome c oxidase subunit I+III
MTATATGSLDALTRQWSTSPGLPGFVNAVNHKQIGLRFVVTAFAFLLIGGVQAVLIRLQLFAPEQTVLGPEAYNQVFTMHGTTMMFLFAIPILEGLAMYLMPLQLGSRDLPFPRLNAFGYWAYLSGGLLLYWSLFTGEIPDGGWFAYTPLSSREFTPGRSLDYWLLGVTFVEISGIVGAIELVVAFLRHRAPGMTLARVPLFAWSAFITSWMILFALPAIVAGSLMLELERKFGMPFYDTNGGGNPLLWQHLFWIFGHPEVYIMLLPATGIVSSIIPVFARRRIAGYAYIVTALIAIAILSFGLWVHHMFTTGLPALVLALFAVSSALIAIPSGVQVFAWLATLWYGRPRWDTPLLFVAGGIFIFVAGGITGVMVAVAPFDFQVHDSYFVVAHFHYVILGGVVFPIFGGLHHWFPKFVGRMPGEALGRVGFWLMFVGFNTTFFVQHVLGLWGMPRRVYTFGDDLGWDLFNAVSSLGTLVLTVGVLVFVVNLVRARLSGAPAVADPWRADTLEWATASPPEPFNFRIPPVVDSRTPLWDPAGPDVAADVQPLLRALAEPRHRLREQPVTSAVDGRFTGVTTLANPSYWPVAATAAITVALIGVLVDTEELVALGAVALVVTVVGWLRPEPGSTRRPTGGGTDEAAGTAGDGEPVGGDDQHLLERIEDLRLHGTRSTGVWGAAMAALTVGTVQAFLLYAYFYLDVSNQPFRPDRLPAPPLLVPAALVAGLAATVWVALALWRATSDGRHGTIAATAALLAASGTAFLAIGALVVAQQELTPTEDSYSAAVVLLLAFHGIATVAAVGIAGFIGYQALRMADHPWLLSASAVSTVWWCYVVVGWIAVGFAVYGYPSLVPDGGR